MVRSTQSRPGTEPGTSSGGIAPEPASPSATVLAWAMVALLVLRVVATVAPGQYAWGLSFARDVAPAFAWPLLALLAAVVGWAALGRSVAPRALRGARPLAAAWAWLLAVALLTLLWVMPDQVRIVGDFVLRLGALDEHWFRTLFPQALPLDRLVNHVLPAFAAGALSVEPLLVMRWLGLLEALVLVLLAVRFARLVSDRASVACVVATIVCFGGYATLLTGYSKPTPQVALCALAAGTLGVELVSTGRAVAGFAAAVSLGLAFHRGGLPLLLVWAVVSVLAWQRAGPERSRLWPLVVPLIVFVAEAPRLFHVIRTFDVDVNFLPSEVRQQGGALAAGLSPLRLMDAANAVLLHAPLAPLALYALAGARRSAAALALSTLMVAFVPVLLFVYLPLGSFRDYDSLGSAGAAFAVASAWAVARGLARVPRAGAIATALAASVAVPFVLMLASLTDLDRGVKRADSLLAGPPQRSATHRASVLDWMGLRALNEERYELARDAYRRLCLETPVPRALKLWGASALIADSPREAQGAFTRLLERVPADPVGWYGLWMSAAAAGDTLTAARASERALSWGSGSPEMHDVVEFFENYPRLYAVLRGLLVPAGDASR